MTVLLDKRVPVETVLLSAKNMHCIFRFSKREGKVGFEGNNSGFTSKDYDW